MFFNKGNERKGDQVLLIDKKSDQKLLIKCVFQFMYDYTFLYFI